jgi:hypothetical protein
MISRIMIVIFRTKLNVITRYWFHNLFQTFSDRVRLHLAKDFCLTSLGIGLVRAEVCVITTASIPEVGEGGQTL